ncbi:MAG: hypothetical protein J0H69_08650 [Burkholderiales bacterium]|nr:hypothetical protein [Burkholderiales bacterium]
MWSAWRSGPASLYLGVGVVLLRDADGREVLVNHASTWPVARVLRQLSEARSAAGQASPARGRRLEVSLSAAHSPAVWCDIPAGVRTWQEKQALRAHQVGSVMQMDAQDVQLAGDRDGGALCSGMAQSLFVALAQWASDVGFKLASVRPLWSQATQSGHAATRAAIVVREPGAVTVVQAQAARSVIGTDAALPMAADVAGFHFSVESGPEGPGAPAAWRNHWELS